MQARYWHADDSVIVCEVCPHHCRILPDGAGRCRVRIRRGSAAKLDAAGYGRLSAVQLDPIEKKPLYHFHPGRMIYSIGGWGCNFVCSFCQNWSISQQALLGAAETSPEDVVQAAKSAGACGLAFTYNEPLVGIEFVEDTASVAREQGLNVVLVTNGFANVRAASRVLALCDALNVDVKSMQDEFYRRSCGGRLAPVLDFCLAAREAGCHVEITNLLIPGLNTGAGSIRALAVWIAEKLGRCTPLHLSAYHPAYRCEQQATSPDELLDAKSVCQEHLHYVYVGNLRMAGAQDTHCPACGTCLVQRDGYQTRLTGIRNGSCSSCRRVIDMVM